MLTQETLARLEAHRAGRLSDDEHEKLLAELDALPEGRREASAYERLWDGLAALRDQKAETRFAAWAEDWTATDETELIDWHLNGDLSPVNAAKIAARKKDDPAFAAAVADQARLRYGLAAARDDAFRQTLESWDRTDTATSKPAKTVDLRTRWTRRLAVAAGVLILLVAGALLYTRSAPDGPTLVADYYKSPPIGNTLGGADKTENTYLEDFTQAHRAMESGAYAEAYEQLSALATQPPPADFSDEDVKYYQDNLDWNIILALIGKQAEPGMITRRLERLLADPTHTYYQDAVNLNETL